NHGGLFGLKGGVFLTESIEADGHGGFITNLSLKDTLSRTKAYLWDGGISYHFGKHQTKVYAAFAVGGVTVRVSDDAQFAYNNGGFGTNRFLSLSYGGGVKALRKWGPLGYRVDIRGRTLPHYYGFQFSWIETTAGLTFAWGER